MNLHYHHPLMKAARTLGVRTTSGEDLGDIYVSPSLKQQGVFKAYMPNYMYRPPFGYPRKENVPLIRQLAKNGYIYSIIKTIMDEVSLAEYDIVYRPDSKLKPRHSGETGGLENTRLEILEFFQNPNRNKESFTDLRKKATQDILEVDSGVWVKVFDRMQRFKELMSYDGGSFLLNPNIHGSIGERAEFVEPMPTSWNQGVQSTLARGSPANSPLEARQIYSGMFNDTAAYFQYNTAANATLPVPFGRREVIYMMQNPRSDSPYGRSPIAILADVITTLVYGSMYNLDFYMNSNMPEGIITLIGSNAPEIKAFRKQIEKNFIVEDPNTGWNRKIAYRIPITQYEAKFTPFQLDPKTMQILEQQQWFYKLVLACFGVPPDAVGLTEDSNRATGQNQFRMHLRKAARPILALIKYRVDMELITEWGEEAFKNLEFKWIDYDIDEEIKKFALYQSKINMGVMSPEMVAEEEGIDYERAKAFQEEKRQQELERFQVQGEARSSFMNNSPQKTAKNDEGTPGANNTDTGKKSVDNGVKTELEKEISKQISEKTEKILNALDVLE